MEAMTRAIEPSGNSVDTDEKLLPLGRAACTCRRNPEPVVLCTTCLRWDALLRRIDPSGLLRQDAPA